MGQPLYLKFIDLELSRRKQKNAQYSMRALARDIKINISLLSRILKSDELPSKKTCSALINGLALNERDAEMFVESIANTKQEKFINSIQPDKVRPNPTEIGDDIFEMISEPCHYEILELTYTENFCSDAEWIADKINQKVSVTRLAIDRLIRVGLLEDKNGRLIKTSERITTQNRKRTSLALRQHQRKIIEKALFSLENDPIEYRSMTSMTMAINPERLPMARGYIEEFMRGMSQILEATPRSEVYNMGISLFPALPKDAD